MKRLFLLGGYDLEMIEIKKILNEKKEEYFDKNLSWGAKLSYYTNEISENKDMEIVGIELIKDMKLDFNYIDIDHHNENIDKKSSLEQVAHLLGIKLTREQMLIAKNDTGYISAMKSYGATKEEIAKIRLLDRQAQGISEEEEKLAEKSLSENKRDERGIVVIRSLTSKFSAITDRLYPAERIFVYTENEFTYYGIKARELGEKYQDKFDDKIYFGGSENGYFGAGEGQLSLDEIEGILREVIDYVGG